VEVRSNRDNWLARQLGRIGQLNESIRGLTVSSDDIRAHRYDAWSQPKAYP